MQTSRRSFIKQTTALAATAATFHITSGVRAQSPNSQFNVAIIGPGGRGAGLLKSFAELPNVNLGWVCDVDSNRVAIAAKNVEAAKQATPRTATDMRRIFEDKSVDAVVIATPDHWHAPATILACDAGKHVYVEKPGSHNIREGRLMIETARRTKRVVQVGTQSRSFSTMIEATAKVQSGAIGEVLQCRVWNSQLRSNIGHAKPSDPPATLDYENWIGPAPMVPFQKNLLHASWRWFHAFGTGDMGNDGVHDIDIGRWGLGVGERHPNRIVALGGKYFHDDDQQFPDTQTVIFEYDMGGGKKKQLIFEQRLWSPYVQEGHENGDAWYGSKGYIIGSKKDGWEMFAARNKPVEKSEDKTKLSNGPHVSNFLECIKTGARPTADVEIHHYSACLAHLGNIAIRVGRQLEFDPKAEKILRDEEANKLVSRSYRAGHWAVPKGV
jgi:predicted dehydrogenase